MRLNNELCLWFASQKLVAYDFGRASFFLHAVFSIISGFPQVNSVCDLGCGDGLLLSRIHNENPEMPLMGVDSSEMAISAAKKRVGCAADISQHDFMSERVDVPEGTLLVANGFTSNLFDPARWRDTLTGIMNECPEVCGLVSDRFFWSYDSEVMADGGLVFASGEDGDLLRESTRGSYYPKTTLRDKNNETMSEVKSYNNVSEFDPASEILSDEGIVLRSTSHKGMNESRQFATSCCVDVLIRE